MKHSVLAVCLCVAVKASENSSIIARMDADEISEMYAHYEYCPPLNQAKYYLDDLATLIKKVDVKEDNFSLIVKAALRIDDCWKLLKDEASVEISWEYEILHENFAKKMNLAIENMSKLVVKEFQELVLDFNTFNEMLSENIGNPIKTLASLEAKQATCQQLLKSLSSATQIIMSEGSSQNISFECIDLVHKEVSSSLRMIMEIPIAYDNDLDMNSWKQFSEEIFSNSIFKVESKPSNNFNEIRATYALKLDTVKDSINEFYGIIISQLKEYSLLSMIEQDIEEIVAALDAHYTKFCETIDHIEITNNMSLLNNAQDSFEKSLSSAINKARELEHAYCPFTLTGSKNENAYFGRDPSKELDLYDYESTTIFLPSEEEKTEKQSMGISREDLLKVQQTLQEIRMNREPNFLSEIDFKIRTSDTPEYNNNDFKIIDDYCTASSDEEVKEERGESSQNVWAFREDLRLKEQPIVCNEEEIDNEIKIIETPNNNNNNFNVIEDSNIASTFDRNCLDVGLLQEWGMTKLHQLQNDERNCLNEDMKEKMLARINDCYFNLSEAVSAMLDGDYFRSSVFIDLLNSL